jgi:hypothetical protein
MADGAKAPASGDVPSVASDPKLWLFQLSEERGIPLRVGPGTEGARIVTQQQVSLVLAVTNIGPYALRAVVPSSVSSFEWSEAPVRHFTIEQCNLPEGEPHIIKTPIPVTVTRENQVDFTASFDEAKISIGGESFRDAFEALVFEVLDTFDYLIEHEGELGAEPERQLKVLSKYLGKAHD